jgi:hypothetical protein
MGPTENADTGIVVELEEEDQTKKAHFRELKADLIHIGKDELYVS